MDTRQIWSELCLAMDDSMSAEFRAQQLSTYLTSTRLRDGKWRGSHEVFILHFKEQIRMHNEIVDDHDEQFPVGQSIKLLQFVITGVNHLATVPYTWPASVKASSSKKKLSFNEYIVLLQAQAQTYD